MKILHLGKFYPPNRGGIERVMLELTLGCNQAGIRTDVLCANKDYQNSIEIINNKDGKQLNTTEETADTHCIMRAASFGKLASTALSPRMIWWLQKLKNKYNIIHIHHPDPMAALALWLTRPNVPIVLQWHSDILRQKFLLQFYNPLLHWLINRADCVLGATKAHIEESDYSQLFMHKAKIITYPFTSINTKEKSQIPIPKNLDNKYFNIFALGRLVYYKGFEYLIEAAKNLDKDCRIFIGGAGELFNFFQDLIIKYQLSDKVFLLGDLSEEETQSYFAYCDVFVLPSIERGEMFGIVQLEAMSFAKPVISTNIERSGISHVNLHNQSGIIIPPKDSNAITQAIQTIKNDKELYKILSQGAIKRLEEFAPKKIIPLYIETYKKLLDNY